MDFYLIQLHRRSPVLYGEGERFNPSTHAELASDYRNTVDRFLDRLARKEKRPAQLVRKLIIGVRDAYYKLEEKIDPMERVFKRLRHAPGLTLYYSPQSSEQAAVRTFEALLNRQQRKHTLWTGVDFMLAVVALALTPVLMPIPGPNLFLYYPALRTISHYLARKGALHGLRMRDRSWVALSEIAEIEAILRQESPGKIAETAANLRLEGLSHFLARYS
jgi:hypothetical protein